MSAVFAQVAAANVNLSGLLDEERKLLATMLDIVEGDSTAWVETRGSTVKVESLWGIEYDSCPGHHVMLAEGRFGPAALPVAQRAIALAMSLH